MNLFSKKQKPKKDKRLKDSILSFWRFAAYFGMTGFVVWVSFLLFFSGHLFGTADNPVLVPEGTINERAIRTFFNILFVCLFMSIFDGVRRRIFTHRPVKRILDALSKITGGDFSVRIKPLHKKRAYNEYDVIIEDINKMAKELSSIETLKTDFISNVSHEIKTPLAVIQNYSTMLQSEFISDSERIEYAKSLESAAKKLSSLITSILKLNKLENQQIFPEVRKYNLSEQLFQSMLLFEKEWEAKELEIITDVDEKVEIEADEELLLTVWSNLISNAVKFTEKKGTLTLKLKSDGEYAIVSVADSGCGMTKETQTHIFEKFYQGDTSHTTEGNGLGLALVKRVIDITEGEITVESEPGRGSEFTVKIPLKK